MNPVGATGRTTGGMTGRRAAGTTRRAGGTTGRRAAGTGRPAAGTEHGSVTVFGLGFCVILLLALAGVAATSSVYLARRSLASVADGAAVAAADAIRDTDVLAGLPADRIGLDGSAAAAAVEDSIAESGAPSRFVAFAWDAGLADGGRTVVVIVRASAPIPLATSLFGVRKQVTVRARATAVG